MPNRRSIGSSPVGIGTTSRLQCDDAQFQPGKLGRFKIKMLMKKMGFIVVLQQAITSHFQTLSDQV